MGYPVCLDVPEHGSEAQVSALVQQHYLNVGFLNHMKESLDQMASAIKSVSDQGKDRDDALFTLRRE